MRDLCMRSACLGAADALVVMDVRDLTFTVCDLDEVDGPGSVVLCETHLDRLRAPNGWTVADVRTRGNLIPLPERPRDPEESDDQMPEDQILEINHRIKKNEVARNCLTQNVSERR